MVLVHPTDDLNDLTRIVASRFVETVAHIQTDATGVSQDGFARVVLTGGTAGIAVLKRIAELDRAAQIQADSFPIAAIDWTRVHVFFGDERVVPVDDSESNEGQARQSLLEHVNISDENIHGYEACSHSLEESAERYAQLIKKYAPDGFDIHLLGMGHEGHINSLFPHTPATAEKKRLTAAVEDSPKPPAQRLTLTLPAVNTAARVWLLVSGSEKAEAVQALVDGAETSEWPVVGAHGRDETVLFVTPDAAPSA
ncbi:6-phosphogluconolactonase [Corynebacterium renale]|uniref:6-phosphogluconolactonase n=1 Tax=Corynebacterium renale TaxID=1724 RepID=UPI000E048BBC|nr:6-phosphogluconolactonase [Corynebacterium renale]STC96096.1 6-phosphogluconolactonase [Corynebacterium renale]